MAGLYVVLAGLAVGIAWLKLRRLSGLSETRKTVSEGLGMLGQDDQQPEIAAPKTR